MIGHWDSCGLELLTRHRIRSTSTVVSFSQLCSQHCSLPTSLLFQRHKKQAQTSKYNIWMAKDRAWIEHATLGCLLQTAIPRSTAELSILAVIDVESVSYFNLRVSRPRMGLCALALSALFNIQRPLLCTTDTYARHKDHHLQLHVHIICQGNYTGALHPRSFPSIDAVDRALLTSDLSPSALATTSYLPKALHAPCVAPPMKSLQILARGCHVPRKCSISTVRRESFSLRRSNQWLSVSSCSAGLESSSTMMVSSLARQRITAGGGHEEDRLQRCKS